MKYFISAFIMFMCVLSTHIFPADALANPASKKVKSFTPAPYYLEIGEDCGTDLELHKKTDNKYSFKIRTGCLDQWRGMYTGEGTLIGQDMRIKTDGGFMNFRFDNKGVNVTIKNVKFKTIEGGSLEHKLGSPYLIEDLKEYLSKDE